MKLIRLSVASADGHAVVSIAPYAMKAPQSGDGFRAIRHADEAVIDANARFVAESLPADHPKFDRDTFIVDENNTIFRADLGQGNALTEFPTDDELKMKWSKLE